MQHSRDIAKAVGTVLTALMLFHGTAHAARIDDGDLIARSALAGDYEDARYERLTYESGGLEVTALLYQPDADADLPVIIFNRGGYVRPDASAELLPMFQRLSASGFAVLAPMYRGSDGSTGVDEMGGADLADLMNTAQLVDQLAGLDADQLYLYGESRGGFMVYRAIREDFPARSAAVYGAFTDLGELFALYPDLYEPLGSAIWSDFETRREDIFADRSAQAWPEALDTPLLIMHGALDTSVPVSQSMILSSRLTELEIDHRLLIFGASRHTISDAEAERDAAALAWFRSH